MTRYLSIVAHHHSREAAAWNLISWITPDRPCSPSVVMSYSTPQPNDRSVPRLDPAASLSGPSNVESGTTCCFLAAHRSLNEAPFGDSSPGSRPHRRRKRLARPMDTFLYRTSYEIRCIKMKSRRSWTREENLPGRSVPAGALEMLTTVVISTGQRLSVHDCHHATALTDVILAPFTASWRKRVC